MEREVSCYCLCLPEDCVNELSELDLRTLGFPSVSFILLKYLFYLFERLKERESEIAEWSQ